MKTRDMVYAAAFAAVLSAVSPFVIWIGPVPLSLATFAVYLAASSLNWKYGTLSIFIYVALGLIGLPVFSGFTGGLPKLAGPTGGFIIGYIPMALIIGLLIRQLSYHKFLYPVAISLGTVILYIFGLSWFIYSSRSSLASAMMACVIPFLPGDVVKIALASVIAPRLKRHIPPAAQ